MLVQAACSHPAPLQPWRYSSAMEAMLDLVTKLFNFQENLMEVITMQKQVDLTACMTIVVI